MEALVGERRGTWVADDEEEVMGSVDRLRPMKEAARMAPLIAASESIHLDHASLLPYDRYKRFNSSSSSGSNGCL